MARHPRDSQPAVVSDRSCVHAPLACRSLAPCKASLDPSPSYTRVLSCRYPVSRRSRRGAVGTVAPSIRGAAGGPGRSARQLTDIKTENVGRNNRGCMQEIDLGSACQAQWQALIKTGPSTCRRAGRPDVGASERRSVGTVAGNEHGT